MPKKKNTDQDTTGETPVAAAKSPDTAAGKTAPVAGTPPAAPPRAPAKKKIPKLAKKNKSRLPRRQKKAQQKAANRQ
jgi:hypothetical protein